MNSMADVLGTNVAIVFSIEHEPFDLRGELTNIAGPGVGLENLDRFGSDSRNRALVLPRVVTHEMRDQRGDVFASLSERRHLQRQRGDSIIEIFAKEFFA